MSSQDRTPSGTEADLHKDRQMGGVGDSAPRRQQERQQRKEGKGRAVTKTDCQELSTGGRSFRMNDWLGRETGDGVKASRVGVGGVVAFSKHYKVPGRGNEKSDFASCEMLFNRLCNFSQKTETASSERDLVNAGNHAPLLSTPSSADILLPP